MSKHLSFPLVLLFTILLLAGCTTTPVSIVHLPTVTPMQGKTATALQPTDSNPTLVPIKTDTPAPSKMIPEISYSFQVKWDFPNNTVDVDQIATYKNNSIVSINDLYMIADTNTWDNCLDIHTIQQGNGTEITNWDLERNWLLIPLAAPLAPGEEIRLELIYTIKIPPIPEDSAATRPIPFGYTQNQVNLVDWHLYFPPFRAESGWIMYHPHYYGEHQVYETANFEIQLEMVNPPANLTIAASSAPVATANHHFAYQLSDARNFVFSAGTSYSILEDRVGDVVIYSYAFSPFSNSAAKEALSTTKKSVELYNRLFGPYPHQTLSIVEADFLDGMEYDGLYFLSRGFYNLYDGTDRTYLTLIAAPETAHQWWYAEVGNDQFMHPWLDESLATYSEYLFYELEGKNTTDWWWAYRVNFYQPSGKIDLAIDDYPGYLPYRNAVYLRGAKFFHDLRTSVGDDVFFGFLRELYSTARDDILSPQIFWEILSNRTDVNISAIQTEYFSAP